MAERVGSVAWWGCRAVEPENEKAEHPLGQLGLGMGGGGLLSLERGYPRMLR